MAKYQKLVIKTARGSNFATRHLVVLAFLASRELDMPLGLQLMIKFIID